MAEKNTKDKIDRIPLLGLLSRCRELINESEDSVWSCMDVEEIYHRLNDAIELLKENRSTDALELHLLFAPTGPLQETSIQNDRSEEYLVLAEQFDATVGKKSL